MIFFGLLFLKPKKIKYTPSPKTDYLPEYAIEKSFITHDVSFNDMISNYEEWLNPDSGVIKATVSF